MKKLLMFILLLTLCCILLPALAEGPEPVLICANTEEADFDRSKPASEYVPYDITKMFDRPFIAGRDLPEGISVSDAGGTGYLYLSYRDADGQEVYEAPSKYRLELLEGDPLFADVFSMEYDKWYNNAYLRANYLPFANIGPGEAKLRFLLESEHCFCTVEGTARVVPFSEGAGFRVSGEQVRLRYKVGDLVSDSYTWGLIDLLIANEPDLKAVRHELDLIFRNYLFNGLIDSHYDEDYNKLYAVAAGVYDNTADLSFRNLKISIPVYLNTLEYEIRGSGILMPGEESAYTVEGGSSRRFTWSVSGDDASIDPETGILTAGSSTETRTLTVTAAPDDGGKPVTVKVLVTNLDPDYHGEPVWLFGTDPLSDFDFSKPAASLSTGVERLFSEPWYTVNSLPEYISNASNEEGINPCKLSLLPDNDSEGLDSIQRYAVEFISGDERLKNVISIRADKYKEETWLISVIPENALTAGEATFRITAETEQCICRQEKTIRFLSYEDDPLFASIKEPVVICGDVGGAIDGTKLTQYIAGRIMLSGDTSGFDNEKLEYLLDALFYWQDGIRYEYIPTWDTDYKLLVLEKSGVYETMIPLFYNNLDLVLPVTIYATDFRVKCSAVAEPGSTVICTAEGAEGRTYTWSLEGTGASIDAQSGTVTINADTPVGSRFVITATPDDGGTPSAANILVYPTGFDGADVTDLDVGAFTFPMLTGHGWNSDLDATDSDLRIELSSPNADGSIDTQSILIRSLSSFVHDEATASEIYVQFLDNLPEDVAVSEIFIDGYPARHLEMTRQAENGISHVRGIVFARDLRLIAVEIAHVSTDGADIPDKAWAEQILERISYNADAAVTWEDAQICVTSANGMTPVVTAGKKLQLQAAFRGQQKIVSLIETNPQFTWTLSDPDNAETGAASISPDGLLSAAKKLDAPVSVLVTASSSDLGPELSASVEVLVLPPVKKIEAETKEVFLYAGTDQAVTVKPVLTPDSIPPRGITWSLKDQGVAELISGEDGTAVFRPLSAGKTTATVTEPGGKKADVKVIVTDPVTDMELTVSGKPKAGSSVTVKAAILPNSAGNKDMEWSLDVGEEIATIKKGVVKIMKGVPEGTVITVACTAAGAPEPVTKTVRIVVEGK